jgi:hypothetical protein
VAWVKPSSATFLRSGAARAKDWKELPACFESCDSFLVSLEKVMLLHIPSKGCLRMLHPWFLKGAMVKGIDHQTGGSAFF